MRFFTTDDPVWDLLAAIIRQAIEDANKESWIGVDARIWLSHFLGDYKDDPDWGSMDWRLPVASAEEAKRKPILQAAWLANAWTVEDLAKAAQLSKNRIGTLCQSGEIEAVRVGKFWAIPEKIARQWLANRRWPAGAWTVAQLAQAVGLDNSRINVRIQGGEIPAVKVGRSYAIPNEVAQRFILERRQAAP